MLDYTQGAKKMKLEEFQSLPEAEQKEIKLKYIDTLGGLAKVFSQKVGELVAKEDELGIVFLHESVSSALAYGWARLNMPNPEDLHSAEAKGHFH